jgi:hypothetical protein
MSEDDKDKEIEDIIEQAEKKIKKIEDRLNKTKDKNKTKIKK